MAKKKGVHAKSPVSATPFEEARDELFQHIIRCGVIQSAPEDQQHWFNETVAYLDERYPELSEPEMQQLRTLGERFAQPPKRRQSDRNAASAA